MYDGVWKDELINISKLIWSWHVDSNQLLNFHRDFAKHFESEKNQALFGRFFLLDPPSAVCPGDDDGSWHPFCAFGLSEVVECESLDGKKKLRLLLRRWWVIYTRHGGWIMFHHSELADERWWDVAWELEISWDILRYLEMLTCKIL